MGIRACDFRKDDSMLYTTDFFKLVSNETRLRILILLAQEELYVCQICGILNLPQPKVSKHISRLRDLDYVVDRRVGKFTLYSLNIRDVVIKNLIQDIVAHIEQYPVLCKDRKQMELKEYFLNQCKTQLTE